ncbi:MAG TPA: alpha-L-arabinofuranosidase C-terminal domain-containing protein [Acidobacteriaceae bacterium]|nr:alpha-L-arabinofuranosidase C-terminal domain-containing protein [Acidobacteriaceae bacterium]
MNFPARRNPAVNLAIFSALFGALSSAAPSLAQITVNKPVPSTVQIEVNAGKPASFTIPRTVFGSFLEPIGDSINQGLSAEILVNPSLETGLWNYQNLNRMVNGNAELKESMRMGLPLPWQPLDADAGSRYAMRYGNAANSWLSLEVMGVAGKTVGIKQQVYLPAQRTSRYTGSLYAKHLQGPSQITVQILSATTGKVLASTHLDATGTAWQKYQFNLELPTGSVQRLEPSYFAVEVQPGERVQLDELSLMPLDAVDGMDPDVIAMAKAMHVSVLRYGGNFTSTYDWRDGVGPLDQRVTQRNLAWGIPEYNNFGTDEFLKFCELIGAEPQIDLNMGTGTPEEAGAWVRYIRERYHGKILWELGNELWGKYQLGYPSLEEMPSLTVAFSKAVQGADLGAEMIATGERPYDFHRWNAALLTAPAGSFNYVSTHFIRRTNQVKLANPTPDFLAEAAFALPVEVERRFKAMQAQINSAPQFAGKTPLALTEWLFSSRGNGRNSANVNPTFRNMGGAIITAGVLNVLLRNANIVPISDMTGIMEFAGIWKKRAQAYGTPSYYAFQMYSTADASRPVHVKSDSGSYSVRGGVVQMENIADVPYLDVVAALNDAGNVLTLFCVNRATSQDLNAEIHLDGFQASKAQIQELKAASLDEGNDEANPKRVTPDVTDVPVTLPEISHVFPHESVTVITLRK